MSEPLLPKAMLIGCKCRHPNLLKELDEDEFAFEVHLFIAENLPDEPRPTVIPQHEGPNPLVRLPSLMLGLDGSKQLPCGLEVPLILEYIIIDDLAFFLTMLLIQKLIEIIFIDGFEVDIQRGRFLLISLLLCDVRLPRLVAVIYTVEFALARPLHHLLLLLLYQL